MASSVSSERAFSAAGITISKRRNRLQGDIVEAIEVIKCLLHHDLLFCEVLNMEHVEKELEDQLIDEELGFFAEAVLQADEFTWDSLIDDDGDA
jgi:hAT family C-terminal dimerisation region